jgi:4-aminobutyrate aminotransferase-like enzyme
LKNRTFNHSPQTVPFVETEFRRIATAIPVPESLPLLERLYAAETRGMHGQLPVVWDRADGFQVFDAWGNRWIDFTSTVSVANAGHGNARIVAALRRVLDKPLLHTFTFATRERADYLEALIRNTPPQFEKAFLLSAGTEATDCVLKLLRRHGQSAGKRRGGVIAFEGNWHGLTLGAQMLSGKPKQKEWIGYLDPNIFHLPFPYPWRPEARNDPAGYFRSQLRQLLEEHELDPRKDLCGVMMETFQGWGAIFYPPEFVQAVVQFAREHGMLVAFDEMQAGFGRTGRLFGYMHYGVEPDLLCCGKGASSSLPLSLVLGSQKVMDLPDLGSMRSTHAANPLACAAGKANLEALLEDGLIENAAMLGAVLHAKLRRIRERFPAIISSIQGRGLVAAAIFNDTQGRPLSGLCDRIAEGCMQRGVLVAHTGRESIKFAPPLCINEGALSEGLSEFEQAVADCVADGELL